MLDIYWRLHGVEDIFFVPYDLELSNQELSWIGKKAEQWRGEEGERKKVRAIVIIVLFYHPSKALPTKHTVKNKRFFSY